MAPAPTPRPRPTRKAAIKSSTKKISDAAGGSALVNTLAHPIIGGKQSSVVDATVASALSSARSKMAATQNTIATIVARHDATGEADETMGASHESSIAEKLSSVVETITSINERPATTTETQSSVVDTTTILNDHAAVTTAISRIIDTQNTMAAIQKDMATAIQQFGKMHLDHDKIHEYHSNNFDRNNEINLLIVDKLTNLFASIQQVDEKHTAKNAELEERVRKLEVMMTGLYPAAARSDSKETPPAAGLKTTGACNNDDTCSVGEEGPNNEVGRGTDPTGRTSTGTEGTSDDTAPKESPSPEDGEEEK